MKRKNIVKIHIIATVIAALCISSFFISSLAVEISGNEIAIKQVKKIIFYSLPILILAMPILGITGNKLAEKSQNPTLIRKKKRMKLVFINGMILISLACYLYYKSNYQTIDNTFFVFQLIEFGFGLFNLTLIGLNTKDGLLVSGKLKKSKTSE